MKRLVVCADGTWNEPEQEGEPEQGGSTNVLKLLRAVSSRANDGVEQVRYYARGVGTNNKVDSWLGGAFGFGLSENVLDCYRFLANNYCSGDEIYIFGFSRGAFTARSLGGLIGAIGFIHPRRLGRLPQGWAYYRTPPKQRRTPQAQAALQSTGERLIDIPIKCLGVWDTVGSLGIPFSFLKNVGARRFEFHDVKLGKLVENAFHALAIDEQRKAFSPALWDETGKGANQVVEQVWFPGVHSNVGGGYADQGLSDIALSWMMEMVRKHTHLDLDDVYISENVHPRADATLYNSRSAYWRFLPKYVRPLPTGAKIHASVAQRLRSSVPFYRPGNLPWNDLPGPAGFQATPSLQIS
jgi:uncharacterized protein (DUF2235 family)